MPATDLNKILDSKERGSPSSGIVDTWKISVRLNEGIINTHGLSNKISTTKYNIITWLPKSLMEQFRRIANVYFLLISTLMLIGTYAPWLFQSPLNPYSTLATLAFVLLLTSLKEGYEDLQRARIDKYENLRKVTVVTFVDGKPEEKILATQDIKSGDIIKMNGRMPVPVDLVVIITSNHADGNQCYVETANIDGETNLKLREAPAGLLSLATAGDITSALFDGEIEFEPPNKNIHNFSGVLRLRHIETPLPLSADNMMLRSSLFSNTDWAYGIAVYTGQETKIQMNNRHAPSKISKVEYYMNTAIIIIFFAQITLVSFSVGAIYMLGFQEQSRVPYAYPSDGTGSVLPLYVEQWFVFFLLYNNFIPISIYVTIEMVNLGQAFMVWSDIKMYDEELGLPCVVRSSNLCQELGMVSNIFSDKTGTLTRNEMKFVKFVVNGRMYEVPSASTPEEDAEIMTSLVRKDALNSNDDGTTNIMHRFLTALATCHTVVRESDGTYRAESPDELALVQGVVPFGCGVTQRGNSSMTVDILDTPAQFDILAINAFNADRKRMSILLRRKDNNGGTGEYILMCKGADNIMLPLCNLDIVERKNIEKSLLDLANMGLRTLCISQKIIDKTTAELWLKSYREALGSLHDRATLLGQIGGELEHGMNLLGVTAIEDRLQDEVPQVIADVAKAGIILWMLTGDKEETAVNIGRSCNLILEHTKLFYLVKLNTTESYSETLSEIHSDLYSRLEKNENGALVYKESNGELVEVALVMDGPSFKHFDESSKEHRKNLLEIGKACRSVIACRLTPVQKQQLVALVKKDTVPRAITLSIGDGANDVSMIREADVGVGIFGKEGRQAANNADFAIGQFKYLRRLLFIHGRLNYSRQSHVFLYSMHKNVVITLTLFWYNFYAAMSGTSMYESWVYSSYNFALGLPIVFYGFMNKDLSFNFALTNPQVYSTGKDNAYLNVWSIGYWIINALLYAVIICLTYYQVVHDSFKPWSIFSMGTLIFTGLVMSMQAKVSFMHDEWTWLQFFLLQLSVWGLILFYVVLNAGSIDFIGEATFFLETGLFWFFGFFSMMIFAVLLDVNLYYITLFFRPTKEMLYREAERNWDAFLFKTQAKRPHDDEDSNDASQSHIALTEAAVLSSAEP